MSQASCLMPFLLLTLLLGCAKPQPLSVIVSGDTAGWIVPCGCTSNQSGGLPRRGTLVEQQKKLGPVVVVDVGGAPSGTTLYDKLKFEAILQGESEMGIAAHNIGQAEAKLGIEELRRMHEKWKTPWISANTTDAQGNPIAEPVRFVNSSPNAKGQRILFVGVLSQQYQSETVRVIPPQQAILKALKTHAGKYDYAFVLAYVPEEELLQLAENLPEVDAVIGGPTGQPISPTTHGHTLTISSTKQGKFLALLTIPPNLSKKREKLHAEIVELSDRFADDPTQQKNVQKYYAELKKRDLAPKDTPFFRLEAGGMRHETSAAAPLTNIELNGDIKSPIKSLMPHASRLTPHFAGSKSCQACHEEEYRTWQSSQHADAWQSLVKDNAQYDPDCQRCHVIGYGLPDGFETASRSHDRFNVGCESCHGPSAEHVQKGTSPNPPRTPATLRAKENCQSCHDRENSPTFELDSYWSKIKHGSI